VVNIPIFAFMSLLYPKEKKSKLPGSASGADLAFPKPDRKKTARDRATRENKTPLESSLQIQTEEFLESLGVLYVRIPDSVLSCVAFSQMWTAKNDVSLYMKGQPDLLLIIPREAGFNFLLALELKREVGGNVSNGQKKWHSKANVSILKTWPEVREEILKFKKMFETENERTPTP
jgi:hypothetical protein